MKFAIVILLGIISWTLTEYFLHRYLGHELKGGFRKFIFFKEHTKHHYKKNYFARTVDKLLTCLGIGPIAYGLSYIIFGHLSALVFTSSFLLMYFVYELVHRRMHTHGPSHAYAKLMRAHHFYHHHKDISMNHGVTTDLWDRVFGTFVKADMLEVYSLEKNGETYENSIMECERN